MYRNTLSIVVVLLLSSSGISNSHRRYQRPPGSYYPSNGYGQQMQDFGGGLRQRQRQVPAYPGQGQMEYGGLQKQIPPIPSPDDDYEGSIQQVSVDEDSDYANFLTPPPPPTQSPTQKYVQSTPVSQSQQSSRTTSSPEAVTPMGTFIGKKETVKGKDVYAFYGIPYAKSPEGPLRFKRPVPADKLIEPFHATTLPDTCPQIATDVFPDFHGEKMWNPNTNTSENCLFLNIWVPATVFEEMEEKQVPIFFWIYGGGYFSGSISLDVYNGATLAATEGIIVVNVQYRLGPLGFLYFGIDDAPGNVGLLDQALGLKWTRENIEYFGGDPNAITLAGESCGASSVGFHLVSPISKNLFKRGMMTSGLPTAQYAIKTPEELKSRSYQLAKHAGCNQKNCKQIVECLRKLDSDKLIALQWKLYRNMFEFPFSPTIDGHFLSDYPENIIKRGKAKRAELILGTVENEGTYFMLYHFLNYMHHLKPTSVPYDRFVEIMEEIFHFLPENEREAVINKYTNWENPEDGYKNQQRIAEAIGDAWFVCPHRHFADEWSNRGLPVYFYHLTQRSKTNPWGEWLGVMHGDDVPLVFGEAVANSSYPDSEKQMTLNFMDMVGSFARSGTPSTSWERYTSEHPVYLDVNATVVTEESTREWHGPRASHCAFWNKLLPILQAAEMQCHLGQFNNQQQQQQQQFSQMSYNTNPSSAAYQASRPEWNNHGQGIHGGQGFLVNNLDGSYAPNQQHHLACPSQFNNPTQSAHNKRNFGQGQKESPHGSCEISPTKQQIEEKSCKCTVSEATSESSQFGQSTDQPEPEHITPKPV